MRLQNVKVIGIVTKNVLGLQFKKSWDSNSKKKVHGLQIRKMFMGLQYSRGYLKKLCT